MSQSIRCIVSSIVICISFVASAFGAKKPDLLPDIISSQKPNDIQTASEVLCNVGMVYNRISNSTIEQSSGTNDWTILIGDDSGTLPSMRRQVPSLYANINDYLYYGSLRIGYHNKLLHLSTDTSDSIIVRTGPDAISDFDTYFNISDQSTLVPPQDKINIKVSEKTFAWSESEADDFIIYEFWITNLNGTALDSIYVALHADCDVSTAEGGSGAQAWSRDDLVDFYRDDAAGEYISYMYDADNPTVPGDDEGGNRIPKESAGFIGSRLLFCPPIVGETTPSVQQGHVWWDWNSDPGTDSDWFRLMSSRLWLQTPPSPHDFRFLQNLGPFSIESGDSLRVVFAFGIGEGLAGLRSNLNYAHLLFENEYVYYPLPPEPPADLELTAIDTLIDLHWTPVSGDIAGYKIYYGTSPDFGFMLADSVSTDSTHYIFMPPERDFFYLYVTAVDSEGAESLPSNIAAISTLPQSPSHLIATPGNEIITLSWNPADSASAYRVYYRTSQQDPYTMLNEIPGSQTNYPVTNLNNGQWYYFAVTAWRWGYESPFSGEVSAIPNPNFNGRVLLVDDYSELDPNGNPIKYQEMRRIYERWGVHNFDYDLWVIYDQGMPTLQTLSAYQLVLFTSDANLGQCDETWWVYVGSIGGGVLRQYLEGGGRLVAIGSEVLDYSYNTNPPLPGDFQYDWFGVDSVDYQGNGAWDVSTEFTWAIAAYDSYPDSMKIDVGKNGAQTDQTSFIYSLRPNTEPIFLQGLSADGEQPLYGYHLPIGTIYRPGGIAKTCLIGFDLKNMPNSDIYSTLSKLLRDEFGCTYYSDPAPLPPWRLAVVSLGAATLFLEWDPIEEEDVVGEKLYRSQNGGEPQLIAQFDEAVTAYTDTNIAPGNTYTYYLTCVDFAGQEGDRSYSISELGGRPDSPQNLAAQVDSSLVNLSWHYSPAPDIAGIRIYRRTGAGGSFAQIAQVEAADTTYEDSNFPDGGSYYYYITAVTIYGPESYSSDTVYAYIQGANPRSGILIVNGCDWATYDPQVYNMYLDRSFTGQFPYRFWDLFAVDNDLRPYPETVIGEGSLNPAVFDSFAVVIWVGNNYNGDIELWQEQEENLINYLNSGGNLILFCRMAADFLTEPFMDYAHITGFEIGVNPNYLIANSAPFIDIHRLGSHSLTDLVSVDTDSTQILFVADNYPQWIAGFRRHPQTGGEFIWIAGRPYRWVHADLQANFVSLLDTLGVSGVSELEGVYPERFFLSQNYPNPFNPTTAIKFGLPVRSDVNLRIYDILGREVKTLYTGILDAGYHQMIWDGRNESGEVVSSGIYFYKLQAGDAKISRKMVLLR